MARGEPRPYRYRRNGRTARTVGRASRRGHQENGDPRPCPLDHAQGPAGGRGGVCPARSRHRRIRRTLDAAALRPALSPAADRIVPPADDLVRRPHQPPDAAVAGRPGRAPRERGRWQRSVGPDQRARTGDGGSRLSREDIAVEAGLLRGLSEAETGELVRLLAKLAEGMDGGQSPWGQGWRLSSLTAWGCHRKILEDCGSASMARTAIGRRGRRRSTSDAWRRAPVIASCILLRTQPKSLQRLGIGATNCSAANLSSRSFGFCWSLQKSKKCVSSPDRSATGNRYLVFCLEIRVFNGRAQHHTDSDRRY